MRFQSTYLYKVRLIQRLYVFLPLRFQSTYLYKVRQCIYNIIHYEVSFNPRTYIRYDMESLFQGAAYASFNPRTYIRYDCKNTAKTAWIKGFNPRTYIRYDQLPSQSLPVSSCFNPRTYIRYDKNWIKDGAFLLVSIHVPI